MLGTNSSFYLYISHWYRTISPFDSCLTWSEITIVGEHGNVRANTIEISSTVGVSGGGMQF